MKVNKSKFTAILVFTGLLFSTARMIRGTDNLYIVTLISFVGVWLLNYKMLWNKEFKYIVFWFMPFGIWAVISSLWSLEPIVSLTRGLFYIFIMFTAVLIGFLYRSKLNALMLIFTLMNLIFILLSYISLISGIPSDAWTANHGLGFTSIFLHQNTLAAVLMFTLIGPVYLLFKNMEQSKSIVIPEKVSEFRKGNRHSEFVSETKSETNLHKFSLSNSTPYKFNILKIFVKPEFIFSLLLFFSNIYFIYLSYSRAVMLALFIGGLLFIYLLGTLKFNIIFSLILLIISLSVFFIFNASVTKYIKKTSPDYFSRRNILWVPSYHAALHGGILGLGFGVTDPNVESDFEKMNRFGELKREKGNSVLALIEEVGIIGLVLFMLPFLNVILRFVTVFKNPELKRNDIPDEVSSLLRNSESMNFLNKLTSQHKNISTSSFFILPFAFLISFLVHSQFEGWMIGISNLGILVYFIINNIIIFKYISFNKYNLNGK